MDNPITKEEIIKTAIEFALERAPIIRHIPDEMRRLLVDRIYEKVTKGRSPCDDCYL